MTREGRISPDYTRGGPRTSTMRNATPRSASAGLWAASPSAAGASSSRSPRAPARVSPSSSSRAAAAGAAARGAEAAATVTAAAGALRSATFFACFARRRAVFPGQRTISREQEQVAGGRGGAAASPRRPRRRPPQRRQLRDGQGPRGERKRNDELLFFVSIARHARTARDGRRTRQGATCAHDQPTRRTDRRVFEQGSRRHGAEVDGAEVDATARKSTPRGGSL